VEAKEQARRAYTFCLTSLDAARETVTYQQVTTGLGYPKGVSGNAIRYGLELLWIACATYGMPNLACIVVDKSTGKPAEGAYPESELDDEMDKVLAYDNWLDVNEMDWDFVWSNRKVLSDRHGTPGYWEG